MSSAVCVVEHLLHRALRSVLVQLVSEGVPHNGRVVHQLRTKPSVTNLCNQLRI